MQDQNQKTTSTTNPAIPPVPPVSDVAAKPAVAAVSPAPKTAASSTSVTTPPTAQAAGTAQANKTPAAGLTPQGNLMRKIVEKIKTSENILVALSRDPSVDEMAAAIGLTLFLDGMQKHTTAIYSGQTPDALNFLQPEGTFEDNTDSLQDFIIALSKDKADHLRYKLDGDFVKVYITPYKTTLSEADLEFSHGDFNVDLVLALGVPSAADLDEALAEYGRIMHDATTVDITCDAPGRFGELEWSDPGASSVSEMITKLIFAIQGPDATIDKEVATALLTGIVASTERFSNNRTNSETMQIASKLMSMGADQQLIAANVMGNDTGITPSSSYQVHQEAPSMVANDHSSLLVGNDYGLAAPAPMTGTVVQPEIPTMPAGGAQKDYSQMMAQALAEPLPVETVASAAGLVSGGVGATSVVSAAPAGVVAANPTQPMIPPMPPVANTAQAAMQPAVNPAQAAAPAEAEKVPVANTGAVTLPPPPEPQTGADMMPPVVPKA